MISSINCTKCQYSAQWSYRIRAVTRAECIIILDLRQIGSCPSKRILCPIELHYKRMRYRSDVHVSLREHSSFLCFLKILRTWQRHQFFLSGQTPSWKTTLLETIFLMVKISFHHWNTCKLNLSGTTSFLGKTTLD